MRNGKIKKNGTELQIYPVTTDKNLICWNTKTFKVITQDLIFQHEKKSKPFDLFGLLKQMQMSLFKNCFYMRKTNQYILIYHPK